MRLNSVMLCWRSRSTLPLLAIMLAAAMLLSLLIGVYPISLGVVAKILLHWTFPFLVTHDHPWTHTQQVVVEVVRTPRILLATLAGAGLGLSGAALQGLMRNPLVGPDLVGVSAGAAFGGVVAILLSFSAGGIVACAFAGGILALTVAHTLARCARAAGILGLILSGIIVGAFFSSLIGFIEYLADPENQLPSIVYWTLGSFANATSQKVGVMAWPTLLGGTALIALRWRINLLSLGDDDAQALGVPVPGLRWVIVALVSLVVAAQVSVSGGVGWVGLVIPHLARMLVGPDHRRLMPASALLGGTFLLLMDDVARGLTGQEIPIGLLTALIGTPVFAVLFWRTQARGWARE